MSVRQARRVSLWISGLTFLALMLGVLVIAIVHAQPPPTLDGVNGDVNILKYEVGEIQKTDLPAQMEAVRGRLMKVENAIDNMNRKQDEATWYYRLILGGILSMIVHRAWSQMYGPKDGGSDSGDGIPILGRKRR